MTTFYFVFLTVPEVCIKLTNSILPLMVRLFYQQPSFSIWKSQQNLQCAAFSSIEYTKPSDLNSSKQLLKICFLGNWKFPGILWVSVNILYFSVSQLHLSMAEMSFGADTEMIFIFFDGPDWLLSVIMDSICELLSR